MVYLFGASKFISPPPSRHDRLLPCLGDPQDGLTTEDAAGMKSAHRMIVPTWDGRMLPVWYARYNSHDNVANTYTYIDR